MQSPRGAIADVRCDAQEHPERKSPAIQKAHGFTSIGVLGPRRPGLFIFLRGTSLALSGLGRIFAMPLSSYAHDNRVGGSARIPSPQRVSTSSSPFQDQKSGHDFHTTPLHGSRKPPLTTSASARCVKKHEGWEKRSFGSTGHVALATDRGTTVTNHEMCLSSPSTFNCRSKIPTLSGLSTSPHLLASLHPYLITSILFP